MVRWLRLVGYSLVRNLEATSLLPDATESLSPRRPMYTSSTNFWRQTPCVLTSSSRKRGSVQMLSSRNIGTRQGTRPSRSHATCGFGTDGCSRIQRSSSCNGNGNQEPPRKTSLYEFHVANSGKMVPFGGFLLPVTYGKEGIPTSHLHTRDSCSVFDVSHMLQTEVRGKDRVSFLESLTTADIQGLADNGSTLTVLTHPISGGILDDLIVTKTTLGYLHVVSNASRRAADIKCLLKTQSDFKADGKDVEVRFFEPEENALLAVQGPRTVEALQPLVDVDLAQLYFMESTLATVAGLQNCRVTRCGYTGEDGVEISLPATGATQLVEALLRSGVVKLAGLGARDSLRLEAGMCLHGNDIDSTTTPVEAGLSWLIGERRRKTGGFPGAKVILEQLKTGPLRRRVGLKLGAGPPARAGAIVNCPDGGEEGVGYVTSGCPSPSLGVNIAMGYVPAPLAKIGTKLSVNVRSKNVEAVVTRLPFIPAKYYTRTNK